MGRPRLAGLAREAVKVLLLAMIVYVAAASSFQTVHVVGHSMQPTLHDGDLLIASRLAYRLHPPQRGDIVLLRDPVDPNRDFIKRIVGVPGDRITIRNHHVYVNGSQLVEPYVHDWWLTGDSPLVPGGAGELIPAQDYFVMGDNRDHSSDSRAFGWIGEENIDAKAELRVWPFDQLSRLDARPTVARRGGPA